MPKIGLASISLIELPWIEALEIAAANNFESFELNCLYPDADPERIPKDIMSKALKIIDKSGIEICLHAPFFELNIAAFCPSIRAESIRLIKKTADLGKKFGTKVVIVHNGTYTYPAPPGFNRSFNKLTLGQWEFNIESLKILNDYFQKNGITLCLENICIASYIDHSFQDMVDIREKVHKSLQYTLDMGHARLSEGVKKGIEMLGQNIRHIHIHDNFGKKDDHLPLGDGNYDYTEFAEFLSIFPYTITMEIADPTKKPDKVLRSREVLKKLFLK